MLMSLKNIIKGLEKLNNIRILKYNNKKYKCYDVTSS